MIDFPNGDGTTFLPELVQRKLYYLEMLICTGSANSGDAGNELDNEAAQKYPLDPAIRLNDLFYFGKHSCVIKFAGQN